MTIERLDRDSPGGDSLYLPRVTIPDIYPRDEDPERPEAAVAMPGHAGAPPGVRMGWIRSPATRSAPVYRRYITYELVVPVTPVPLLGQLAEAETLVVQVTSAAANPVFSGNQGVTTTNGTRINPGQALVLAEDNRRYAEEQVRATQELTEVVAMGLNVGVSAPPAYYNPRVVLNPNDFYLVTAIQRNVTVTLYYPPERV